MSWKTVKSKKYYYHNYKHNGKVYTLYYGRGPLAEAVATLDADRRRRRGVVRLAFQELTEAGRRQVAADRRRIVQLCEIVDRAMRASGYYRHRGQWRRRGIVTMRGLDVRDGISQAIEREKARRFFESLDPDDVEAEIERHQVELSTTALNELIGRITSDAYRQEAYVRKVGLVEAELRGDNHSPIVKLLARNAAILWLEVYFADFKFYGLAGIRGGLGTSVAGDVLKWRSFAHRELRSVIKTLAYVRHVEESVIENTIERLRIVG